MVSYPFKTKPYAHQLECWEISKDQEVFGLLLEMGGGKSKILIDTIAYLYDQGKINGVLLVAPKSVYRNWYNVHPDGKVTGEFPTHMPDHVRYYATYWSAYRSTKVLKAVQKLFEPSEDLHIFLMNTEALSTESGLTIARKFLSTHRCLMAVDESTMIKNMKAKRTVNAINLGALARYRRILTGLPTPRSPLDIYAQAKFLSWHLLGFSSFYTFRNRYAIMQKMYAGNRSFDKVVGYQRMEELTGKLQGFTYRKLKRDCLDLPPKVYMYREVELTDEQARAYAMMRDQGYIMLENNAIVTTKMKMNQLQKMHEIVCGFIRNSETGEVTPIPNNRAGALVELLDEVNHKALIWCAHVPDIITVTEAISKEFGPESVAAFYGGTDYDRREQIKRNFQDPGHPLRFFVGTPASGKFGSTLTEADTAIYYSNDYDLENRLQSEDRFDRIGQKADHITVVDLVTRGTVDEKIIEAMRMKKNLADLVTGDDFREWLK